MYVERPKALKQKNLCASMRMLSIFLNLTTGSVEAKVYVEPPKDMGYVSLIADLHYYWPPGAGTFSRDFTTNIYIGL